MTTLKSVLLKRLCWALGLSMLTAHAHAGYAENVGIVRVHTKSNGFAYVWTSAPPSDTCNWYAEHFRFDATTPAGKAMLANLLVAQALNKPFTVWYTPATAPGTNQDNGCTETGLAVVTGIAQR